jgi:hypothetical protein
MSCAYVNKSSFQQAIKYRGWWNLGPNLFLLPSVLRLYVFSRNEQLQGGSALRLRDSERSSGLLCR